MSNMFQPLSRVTSYSSMPTKELEFKKRYESQLTRSQYDGVDPLIEWIQNALRTLFRVGAPESAMHDMIKTLELRIDEYRLADRQARRKLLVQKELGPLVLFTPLPLSKAFDMMDAKYRFTARRHVPISFHEVRQTLNLSQVLASAPDLQLVTFDGDETLYPNGTNFEDHETADFIIQLLKRNIKVALVTAAGYGIETAKYEVRVKVLLDCFRQAKLDESLLGNFYVFGGESNYLLRCGVDCHLYVVDYSVWEEYSEIKFSDPIHMAAARHLLDVAEKSLNDLVSDLSLRAQVVRKERGVGLVPGGLEGLKRVPKGSGSKKISTETLEEAVVRVRVAADDAGCIMPFCAFNGGTDAWVDVGNKGVALTVLQGLFRIQPAQCIHVGDQFNESGNDITVRHKSPCIWVVNPNETKAILRRILAELAAVVVNKFPDAETASLSSSPTDTSAKVTDRK